MNRTILSIFICVIFIFAGSGANIEVQTKPPFQHGWTDYHDMEDWVNYVQIYIENYENESVYIGTELIIEFDILETENIVISGSRFQCTADIYDIGGDQYNISISYSDNLTNNYVGNYTYDKTFFGVFNEPTRLQIMNEGIIISRNVFGTVWTKDTVYFYNQSGSRGWLFSAININTEDDWRINIRTEPKDSQIGELGGLLGLLSRHTPYSGESLTILEGFALVLKLSVKGLVFLLANVIHVLIVVEAIFLLHASQQKDNISKLYRTLINDNVVFYGMLLNFFKGLITLIIRIVEMINPF
ncbi:MAG: hypothetical protein SVR08_18680 [Spirochaetota bacterium]|nr:hypothetical protein [Spirochaetota bacterium]